MKVTVTPPEVQVHVLFEDRPTGPFGPHGSEAQAIAASLPVRDGQPGSVSVRSVDSDGEERWRFITWDALPEGAREEISRRYTEAMLGAPMALGVDQ